MTICFRASRSRRRLRTSSRLLPRRQVSIGGVVSVAILICASNARAGTIFVDSGAAGAATGVSWVDAHPSLVDALALSTAGDRVFVKAGTYLPDQGVGVTVGDRDVSFFLRDCVSLYGGFAGTEATLADRAGLFNDTVLSGDLAGDDGGGFTHVGDNSRQVVRGVSLSSATIVDGFTIRGGASDPGAPEGGAGMFLSLSNVYVRRCVFRENESQGAKGAAFSGSGGAVFITQGSPSFMDCSFVGNHAAGVGGASSGFGGAVYHFNQASPAYVNCRFVGNVAEGSGEGANGFGGAAYSFFNSSPSFTGCVFSGNRAVGSNGFGGALYNLGADVAPNIANCSFHANEASGGTTGGGGGGIYNFASSPTITSTILWNNEDVDGVDESAQIDGASTTPQIQYSCVEGLTGALGGIGNIGADPSFFLADGADGVAGTEDDDLRLLQVSPCLDAGDTLSLPTDWLDADEDGDLSEILPLDLAGGARRVDDSAIDTGTGVAPIVDIGALERAPICQVDVGFQGPGSVSLAVCGDDLSVATASAELVVAGTQPNAPVFLFVGTQAQPTPIAGGVLVPVPTLLVVGPLPADGAGSLSFPVPGGSGPPVELVLQAIAPNGPSLEFSNALRVVVGT